MGLAALLLVTSGCSGPQNALDPPSPQARHIASLWWIFFGVSAVVWTLVLVFLAGAMLRRRSGVAAEAAVLPELDRRMNRVVIGAVIATVLALIGLLLADLVTNRSLGPPDAPDALTIKLTGRQWWWQAEYQDPVASNTLRVANELHVPTGRPILFQLQSTDVIHSFWMPNLQGKKDLIPGRPTSLWLQIDRPGTYRGQCAEFCGYQHAHMGLLVLAEPPDKFAAWQQAQRTTPPGPSTDRQKRGQQLFLTGSCVLCHTIDGTLARSRVGPPLTHLASQQTIGAGAFANTRANLARWIRDPHTMKPGVRMPQNFLSQEDLDALLDYLATLK
jgi:cytochrome c oxidase subunit 2